jgi:hypothetical protein
MKFYPLYLSCHDFFNLCIRIFTVLNTFGNFSSSRIRTKLLLLGVKSTENSYSGAMTTVQWKNPSHPRKNPRRLVFPSMHAIQSSLPMHPHC